GARIVEDCRGCYHSAVHRLHRSPSEVIMKRVALFTLLLAAPASAQVCGPLTFAFGTTGPGCAPFGGAIPTLGATLAPSPTLASCPVLFTVTPGPSPTPIGVLSSVLLILGASNPALDLTGAGLPGCTLLAFPDVILPMTPTAPGPVYTLTVPVPADPSLIGGVAFAQGAMMTPSPGAVLSIRLSNGVDVTIS
ncbi:MAG TPA: hypothetical protein VKF62_13285, partial [Planctomycetota bacterium]|nr:hypothetical protein [Planctomycetota bacterium]